MIEIIFRALAIFLSAFIGDVVWSLYIKHIAANNRVTASNYGAAIGICYIVSIMVLIDSMWYGVFHIAGLWFGTYYHQEAEKRILKILEKIWNKK